MVRAQQLQQTPSRSLDLDNFPVAINKQPLQSQGSLPEMQYAEAAGNNQSNMYCEDEKPAQLSNH